MAWGLARPDAVAWAKLAYTWNFLGLLVHTLLPRYKEVSSGVIRKTLFFRPPPAMARGLAHPDAVAWAKSANTWNFHVLLVHAPTTI